MKIKDNVGSRVSNHLEGVGEISIEMIEKRAKEIAVLKSRNADDYTDEDWMQAKEELLNPQSASELHEEKALEKIEAWDQPVTESGHEVKEKPLEDEFFNPEILVEEGVREAEHERMVEAHKRSKSR
jgi:hypothetical protein